MVRQAHHERRSEDFEKALREVIAHLRCVDKYRHSRESGNPVAEVVNHGSDSFIIPSLDSYQVRFRRSDGLVC